MKFGYPMFLRNRKCYRSCRMLSRKMSCCSTHVTLVGACGSIGQALALLLKRNPKINRLNLHDIHPITPGVGMDLADIPTLTNVETFFGDDNLECALRCSNIVVVAAGVPRKPGMTRAELFPANAAVTVKIVENIAKFCPDAFVAIITNPINSIVPLAAQVLQNHCCYNPKKVFGVTTIDVNRTKAYLSKRFCLHPNEINIPVVCGHSAETIVPLFSQMSPKIEINSATAKKLTCMVQTAGNRVVESKAGSGGATVAMAHAASDFTDTLLAAILGAKPVTACSFVANNDWGTEFFAGPVTISKDGICDMGVLNCLTKDELGLIEDGIKALREDVHLGQSFYKSPTLKKDPNSSTTKNQKVQKTTTKSNKESVKKKK